MDLHSVMFLSHKASCLNELVNELSWSQAAIQESMVAVGLIAVDNMKQD